MKLETVAELIISLDDSDLLEFLERLDDEDNEIIKKMHELLEEIKL